MNRYSVLIEEFKNTTLKKHIQIIIINLFILAMLINVYSFILLVSHKSDFFGWILIVL
jgi:magnesium-transporting ATPase (P-type)